MLRSELQDAQLVVGQQTIALRRAEIVNARLTAQVAELQQRLAEASLEPQEARTGDASP